MSYLRAGIDLNPRRLQIEKPIATAWDRSPFPRHLPRFLRQCLAISCEMHALADFDILRLRFAIPLFYPTLLCRWAWKNTR